ncbi:MAG: hypothetical protein GX601_03760 [Anaerolineales bacterium]|nr:hypothetical protein [Anaerolineales bacterium]
MQAPARPGLRAGLALGLLWLAVGGTGCASQPLTVTREPAAIRLISSEAVTPLAQALASAYAESHTWVSIEVTSASAAFVGEELQAERADLALTDWIPEGASPWSTPFTHDAIAIIAHRDLPIESVDLGRLHEIFRGHVQEWEGRLLVVVIREDGSATRISFDQVVIRDREPALMAVVMPSSRAVIDFVASTPNALGYTSVLHLTQADLERVRIVSVGGVAPSREAVADGRYLLGRQVYLAAPTDPAGPLRDFAQWLLGPEGQTVTASVGAW